MLNILSGACPIYHVLCVPDNETFQIPHEPYMQDSLTKIASSNIKYHLKNNFQIIHHGSIQAGEGKDILPSCLSF